MIYKLNEIINDMNRLNEGNESINISNVLHFVV